MPRVLFLLATTISFISLWRVFEKASFPGWAILIPGYNVYILLKVSGKPIWWIIFLIFPMFSLFVHYAISIISAIFYFFVLIGIAHNFKQQTIYAVGLFFFPVIFWPMLAFGKARYEPVAEFTPI